MHNNIPESNGGHFSRWRPWKSLLDGFLQASAILMILVSNHTSFLIMQNLDFDLWNLVKAYLTKYETKS